MAVAAILTYILCSIRTLGRMKWITSTGLVSILSASKYFNFTYTSSPTSTSLLTLLHSPDSHNRRWCTGPSQRCTARYPLEIRLPALQKAVLPRRRLRSLQHRLCIRRNQHVLLHRGRNARAPAVYPLLILLPVHRHFNLSYNRCGGILLLRVICCLSGSGLCRPSHEENLLWA